MTGVSGDVQIGFRFGSDGNTAGEGWYVDDLTVSGITTDNHAPGAPVLVSPVPGETVGAAPTLNVVNAIDPDPADELTYGFRIFADQLQTTLVVAIDGVPEGPAMTAWTVSPPLADGTYYWDAYAFDGIERGPCMTAGYFNVVGDIQSVDWGPMAGGLHLLGATPNPAPGAMTLSFQLAQGGRIEGGVFDLQGRRLRSLAGQYPAGQGNLHWDGRDDLDRDLPAGVYLFTLQAGDEIRRGRLMLVR